MIRGLEATVHVLFFEIRTVQVRDDEGEGFVRWKNLTHVHRRWHGRSMHGARSYINGQQGNNSSHSYIANANESAQLRYIRKYANAQVISTEHYSNREGKQ